MLIKIQRFSARKFNPITALTAQNKTLTQHKFKCTVHVKFYSYNIFFHKYTMFVFLIPLFQLSVILVKCFHGISAT